MDFIQKYGKYAGALVTIIGFLFGIYVRFVMDEREMEITNENVKRLEKELTDHEHRLRVLECR